MASLFSSAKELEQLPMVGADVSYVENFDLGVDPDDLLAELIASTPWRAETVVVWGKSHPQPRLVAWFGDSEKSYSYSGINLSPLPWTASLLAIRERVQAMTDATFNSVLLNYYRDHRDSMGFHSDDEPELGPRPTIASVSLGETRTFIFKPKMAGPKPVKIPLVSGSLLVMRGDTQKNWKHGIEKSTKPCGPRVNLTFRFIRNF